MFPYPSQIGQAPYGLLKLKRCTLGSKKVMPSNSKLVLKAIFFSESNC